MKKSDIHVLIVDDDKAIGKTLSEAIVRAGYKPLWASRADEALNMVRLTHVQVAVIDCMLPLKNGVVLAEELRKTRFENGAIILMSGVFRDKSFEADALKRTNALVYLQKPFGPSDLIAALKPALDKLVDTQKWTLQSVFTKKIESVRDRVKIVEHLEEIRGVEAAFALSILMEAKISGFLNLVSATGDIYGIVLQNGKVASVDSEDAEEVAIKFLVDTGYLANDDWQEFSVASENKVRMQKLLAAGYISPHAAFQARREQIVSALKRILKSEKVNVSFVPDSGADQKNDGVEMADLFTELNETLDDLLPLDYLRDFFQTMIPSTVRTLSTLSTDHAIWKLSMLGRVKETIKSLDGLSTLEQLIQKNPEGELALLKAIYMLVIFGQALFTDREQIMAYEAEAGRRQKLVTGLTGKSAYEIFEYFGAKPGAKVKDVETIFKEFVRNNHPDRLPPDALQSLKDVTQRLFQMVSGAYDTLSDAEKRAAYEQQLQSQNAEKELRAEAIMSEAMELIRRGSYAKADERLKEAGELSKGGSSHILYLTIWAKLKLPGKMGKPELSEWQKKLDAIPNVERNTPLYHMALGLIRAANGDQMAINSFEKAVSIDGNFLEARREISAMRPVKDTNSSPDLLTGDITQIVSQIFKRKAK
jgi:DNA-binding response OmpR family regulator